MEITQNRPFFSIIIPECDSTTTPHLFSDLINQTNDDFEVLYVSSNPNEKTDAYISNNSPWFSQITTQETNCNAQNNIGIAAAQGTWILVIHPTVRLPEYFIDGLLYQIEQHPDSHLFTTRISTNTKKIHQKTAATVTNLGIELMQSIGSPSIPSMFLGLRREVSMIVSFDTNYQHSANTQYVQKAKTAGFSFTVFRDPEYFSSLQKIHNENIYKVLESFKNTSASDIASGTVELLQPNEEVGMFFKDIKKYSATATKHQKETLTKRITSIRNSVSDTEKDSLQIEDSTPVDVFIATAEMGHTSIAHSIQSGLQSLDISSRTFETYNSLMGPYELVYTYKPHWNKYFFNAVKAPSVKKITDLYHKQFYKKEILKEIENHSPKVTISTHFSFNPALEKKYIDSDLPFINVLTDPRTSISVNYSTKCLFNCVFDEKQKQKLESTHPGSTCLVTGWFVRSEYEQEYDKVALRRKYNINTDKPVFLFSSGSVGTRAILPILQGLLASKPAITILVACGNNTQLLEQINELKETTNLPNTHIEALSFTNKLYEYMQLSDLVIGKAGPNTLFETVATLTPFFATSHVSGQEDGNLEIIEEYNLGYVEEDTGNAITKLIQISENPQELAIFDPYLKKLANHNKQSKVIISREIQKILNE